MCAPNFRNRCWVFCDVTLDNSMKLNHTQCISLVSWSSRIENFHFYKVFCGSLPTIRNIWIHVLDAQADLQTHIRISIHLTIKIGFLFFLLISSDRYDRWTNIQRVRWNSSLTFWQKIFALSYKYFGMFINLDNSNWI